MAVIFIFLSWTSLIFIKEHIQIRNYIHLVPNNAYCIKRQNTMSIPRKTNSIRPHLKQNKVLTCEKVGMEARLGCKTGSPTLQTLSHNSPTVCPSLFSSESTCWTLNNHKTCQSCHKTEIGGRVHNCAKS